MTRKEWYNKFASDTRGFAPVGKPPERFTEEECKEFYHHMNRMTEDPNLLVIRILDTQTGKSSWIDLNANINFIAKDSENDQTI